MIRDDGRVLKVDMPLTLYKSFVDDAFNSYGGHYWYKISIEGMMFKKMLETQPIYLHDEIIKVRTELIILINEKYKLLKEYKKIYGELN